MSHSDIKQFLTTLNQGTKSNPKKTSEPTPKKAWNYKEWSNKEREKFLLRKRKVKLSKADKIKRRVEGQKVQKLSEKKIKKVEIKQADNYKKNLDFLKNLQEQSKLKKDVYDKILKHL